MSQHLRDKVYRAIVALVTGSQRPPKRVPGSSRPGVPWSGLNISRAALIEVGRALESLGPVGGDLVMLALINFTLDSPISSGPHLREARRYLRRYQRRLENNPRLNDALRYLEGVVKKLPIPD